MKPSTRRRRRGATAAIRPPSNKRTKIDSSRLKFHRNEIIKCPSARSRLWQKLVRIKNLFTSASVLAFSRRPVSASRQDHGRPETSSSSDSIRKRVSDEDHECSSKQRRQTSSFDHRVCTKKKETSNEGKKVEIRSEFLDRVIQADCLEYLRSMPSGILSCTITCPPSNTRAIEKEDGGVAWSEFVRTQAALLEQLYRVTKPGGHLWYVHKVQQHKDSVFHPVSWLRRSPWQVRQEIVWDKMETQIACNPKKFWPIDQRIYWLYKEPGPRFELNRLAFKWGSIWRWRLSDSDEHSFPLLLALAILHASNLSRGSLVFDPYGRLGTTAKACQIFKQHFLTTEIDESKIKAINHRLKENTPEDNFWKSFASKQISNRTLDLKRVPESFFPSWKS